MNKLIKTKVLTVYISQFLLFLVIPFCNAIPLWSATIFITGFKSFTVFFIVIAIYFINIWFLLSSSEVLFFSTFFGSTAQSGGKYSLTFEYSD